MAQKFNFEELRRQACEMREQIPAEIAARPNTSLDDYYAELQGKYAPEAVRTALWDLISDQTLVLQRPGNTLKVLEPATN